MLSRRLLANVTGQFSSARACCSLKSIQQQRYFSNSTVTCLNRRELKKPGDGLQKGINKKSLILPQGNSKQDMAVFNLNQRLSGGGLDNAILKYILTSDNHVFLPLGSNLIDLYVMEAFQEQYPYLPGPVLTDLSNYYRLPNVLDAIARNLGVVYVRGIIDTDGQTTTTTTLKSIVGLVSKSVSHEEYQEFMKGVFHASIRKLNIKRFISNPHATEVLNIVLNNPEYSILNESGRKSDQSIYRVGVFKYGQFLAEGTDRKISRAKFLAADKALLDFYLTPAGKEPELLKICNLQQKTKDLDKKSQK